MQAEVVVFFAFDPLEYGPDGHVDCHLGRHRFEDHVQLVGG